MSEAAPVVYIVDDDDIARNYLGVVLSGAKLAYRAVASAESFLLNHDPHQPGCLLLDVQMPGMSGLELQQQLNLLGATIPVIFITGHAEVPMVVDALQHGAFGFLQKPVDPEVLLAQIAKALSRDAATRSALQDRERMLQRFHSLTPREREILSLLVAGRSNKAMASDLLLSQRTVELYRARVMEKTGSSSLAELVRMATQLQVTPAAQQRRPSH